MPTDRKENDGSFVLGMKPAVLYGMM